MHNFINHVNYTCLHYNCSIQISSSLHITLRHIQNIEINFMHPIAALPHLVQLHLHVFKFCSTLTNSSATCVKLNFDTIRIPFSSDHY